MLYTQRSISIIIKKACALKRVYVKLGKGIQFSQRANPSFKVSFIDLAHLSQVEKAPFFSSLRIAGARGWPETIDRATL